MDFSRSLSEAINLFRPPPPWKTAKLSGRRHVQGKSKLLLPRLIDLLVLIRVPGLVLKVIVVVVTGGVVNVVVTVVVGLILIVAVVVLLVFFGAGTVGACAGTLFAGCFVCVWLITQLQLLARLRQP